LEDARVWTNAVVATLVSLVPYAAVGTVIFSVTFALPTTCKFDVGVVVPIPIYPFVLLTYIYAGYVINVFFEFGIAKELV
jgi:hypothetical protein